MLRTPGEIVWLPPSAVRLDKKDRPHLLLTASPPFDWVMACIGTTQDLEASFGAAAVVGKTRQWDGSTRDTFWYPSQIVPVHKDKLPTASSRNARLMDKLRAEYPIAHGIGTGTWSNAGRESRSLRGRFVRVNDAHARMLRTDVGLVITEHGYSSERRYQVMVPLHGKRLLPESTPVALQDSVSWGDAVLGTTRSRVIAAMAMVVTVADKNLDTCAIIDVLPDTVDPDSLATVESALMRQLGA
jgi:hypothetical protein